MRLKDVVPESQKSRCFWNLLIHFCLGLTVILVLFTAPVPNRLYVAAKVFLGALACLGAAYGMAINIAALGEVYGRETKGESDG